MKAVFLSAVPDPLISVEARRFSAA